MMSLVHVTQISQASLEITALAQQWLVAFVGALGVMYFNYMCRLT